MASPKRNDDLAVEVYLAHTREPTVGVVELAARFGIAHSTARRYVLAGQASDQWLAQFDRGEIATTVHMALSELLHSAMTDAERAEDGRERADHRRVALGVVDRIMRLHDLAAPIRFRSEEPVPRPPDPEFAERIRRARLAGDRELARDLDPNDTEKRF